MIHRTNSEEMGKTRIIIESIAVPRVCSDGTRLTPVGSDRRGSPDVDADSPPGAVPFPYYLPYSVQLIPYLILPEDKVITGKERTVR